MATGRPRPPVQQPSRRTARWRCRTAFDLAGWYAPGPRPGDLGSAVIFGHVDSDRGPAVFYRLRELRPGDQLTVTGADGSSVRFVVQRTQ
jgi:sortase (surface protein transpeptidase)